MLPIITPEAKENKIVASACCSSQCQVVLRLAWLFLEKGFEKKICFEEGAKFLVCQDATLSAKDNEIEFRSESDSSLWLPKITALVRCSLYKKMKPILHFLIGLLYMKPKQLLSIDMFFCLTF